MDPSLKQRFAERWRHYFPGAGLPIGFYYAGDPGRAERVRPQGHHCLICDLAQVRDGASLAFDVDAVGCGGGRRYLGFVSELRPGFEYFLSCGIPGEMEGERYKKSPQLVQELLERMPRFEAPDRYIIFKHWERMDEDDEPAVILFFATPDVLSGLFTLAGYDESDPQAIITPFASGCASIVCYPYLELGSPQARAVLGMFDVSARPCVPADVLTFAIPWPRFVRMVDNMDESFLITTSWHRVRTRIGQECTT